MRLHGVCPRGSQSPTGHTAAHAHRGREAGRNACLVLFPCPPLPCLCLPLADPSQEPGVWEAQKISFYCFSSCQPLLRNLLKSVQARIRLWCKSRQEPRHGVIVHLQGGDTPSRGHRRHWSKMLPPVRVSYFSYFKCVYET